MPFIHTDVTLTAIFGFRFSKIPEQHPAATDVFTIGIFQHLFYTLRETGLQIIVDSSGEDESL